MTAIVINTFGACGYGSRPYYEGFLVVRRPDVIDHVIGITYSIWRTRKPKICCKNVACLWDVSSIVFEHE